MKFRDLLTLALRNLFRRKTRTVLTVLGVIIGTSSILVMMSLGLGMSRQTKQLYQEAGSMKTITVYAFNQKGNETEITDDTLKQLKQLDHVEDVSPQLDVSVTAKCGPYEGYLSLTGVSQAFLKELPVKSGKLPPANADNLSLVYGNHFQDNFYKASKSGSGNIGSSGDVQIDPMKDTIFFIFPEGYKPAPKTSGGSSSGSGGGTGTSAQSSAPSSSGGDNAEKGQKKYILDTAAILDGGSSGYNSYSYSVYCDIDTLKGFLKQRYRKYLVPEPKLNKKGKPVDYYVYSQAYVFVDDMSHVSEVQKKIATLGYQADSNMEWLEQSKQFTGMVQAVLGGIGAVSLLVAAIGIINTMMMSIYERTREIGVMKVLGCDMTNIRDLFLVESGFIGLMGGIIGTVLSLLISLLINFLVSSGGSEQLSVFYQGAEGAAISYIPIWLALFAIVFAIFIGAAAGYLPAKRAMRLSPLAAMRNE